MLGGNKAYDAAELRGRVDKADRRSPLAEQAKAPRDHHQGQRHDERGQADLDDGETMTGPIVTEVTMVIPEATQGLREYRKISLLIAISHRGS